MRKIRDLPFGVIATCLMLLISVAPARAQASRTWVSGVGDDANPCSRVAPCKTFAGAISKTTSGGIINCLDSGGFGAVTITKSVTIDCSEMIAGVLAAGTNAINVNGTGAVVILRGLDLEGEGTGLVGINISQAASVQVEKCRIFGFGGGAARGISYVSSGGGSLFVSDTIISNNNTGVAGAGIFVDPGSLSALVTLERVHLYQNFEGFRATGAGTGIVHASIIDSVATNNGTNGFAAQSPAGGALVTVDIQRSASVVNGTAGILADGPITTVTIGATLVAFNSTGLSHLNGGAILSYQNNNVDNNTTNGTVSGTINPL